MGNKNYAKYMSSVQMYLFKKVKNDILVLLQQKAENTWAPLLWEAGVCGHVDHGESPIDAIIHEAKEELNINIKKNDLKFISVMYKDVSSTHPEEHAFYNFAFYTEKWTGEPIINEPHNTIKLEWFNIKKLPKDIIPDRKTNLENFIKNIYYSEFTQK